MYTITREIGIDAGHRVMTHGSKCRNLHGHRYRIQATCIANELHTSGEQTDMVLDFGFLKEEMMKEIDEPCDHGFIFCIDDPWITRFLDYEGRESARTVIKVGGCCPVSAEGSEMGKLYVVPFIPTAEKLAEHWFMRLAPRVAERSGGLASLIRVCVWETPNCKAEYFQKWGE